MADVEKLLKEVEEKRTEFRTESYPMSIGELVNLFHTGEIEINPDFQRFFRWTDYQKSKLIESILLGIPVPTIFVYQTEAGVWELVDGLQRISTILQLMGLLPGKERLVLQGTKYLPSFDGFVWEKTEETDVELPAPVKLTIKRAKFNLTIILSESGRNAKFDVFQRLNTGGSYASDQEVRNSVMIMVNKLTFTWFKELSDFPDFLNTISISERLLDEQYHMELVLRHISLLHFTYTPKKELKDYFDDITEEILGKTDFNYEQYKTEFENTFSLLNEIANDDVFRRFVSGSFKGKFLESAFEAISVGIGYNYSSYKLPEDIPFLRDKIEKLHNEEVFRRYTGSGSNAKTRINNIIPFAKGYFAKNA